MKLNIRQWFDQLTHIAQLAVFLSECKGCGKNLVFEDEDILCRACKNEISLFNDPVCRICGRILGNPYDTCGECILHPPPYRLHLSYSRYRGLLKDLILLYKYGGIEKLKYLFADYYIELFYQRINEPFDYIIPVPPDRGRKREFAPILEAGKILSGTLEIPLLSGYLIKVKKTLPQAGLSKAKRMKNLDGAFKLKRLPGIKLTGKKVLMIDDVYTTGTTITKCAQLLSKQKADVVVLTLARS